MEHGDNGWTHSATGADQSDQWTMTSVHVASGRRSWQAIPHDSEGSEALVSPVIDLTGHAQARLRFATWYAFDDCSTVGYEPDGGLVEVIELKGHPWFLAVQCHPEFKSKPTQAHPLFRDFVRASLDKRGGKAPASHRRDAEVAAVSKCA
jgi:hypothetical protein